MTHIVTSLCLRDSGCAEVCPVECIVPGTPKEKWPLYYIDPDTCIDCGACIPECPYEAIFPEDEVSDAYEAPAAIFIAKPQGTPGFTEHYEGVNHHGVAVVLDTCKKIAAGEVIDLTEDIQANYDFFSKGPGYWDGWEDHAK
jgi:NAD-dependent dihydropyrimidine dehydrogenase PreA subunit